MGIRIILLVMFLLSTGCASSGSLKPTEKSLESAEGANGSESKFSTREIRQIEAFISQGETLYLDRNFEMATDSYKQVLDIDSANVRALYRLGNISFRNKDWIKARNYYERVVEIEPRHSKAQYNLSMTYLSLSEKHLKFFAATTDDDANLSMVSDIMRFLNSLSASGGGGSESLNSSHSSLDSIADQILGN